MEAKPNGIGVGHKIEEEIEANFQKMKIGDLCPECGQAAVVNGTRMAARATCA